MVSEIYNLPLDLSIARPVGLPNSPFSPIVYICLSVLSKTKTFFRIESDTYSLPLSSSTIPNGDNSLDGGCSLLSLNT